MTRFRFTYAGAFWVPLALAVVATKLAKAVSLSRTLPLPIGTVTALLSEDVLFHGAAWILSGILLGARRAWLRRGTVVLLHVGVPLLFAILLAEHLFFRTSGALADWYLLKEGIRGLPHLLHLYRGELTMPRLALLVAPWAYSLAVFVAVRPYYRNRTKAYWVTADRNWRSRWVIGITLGGLLGAGARAVSVPPDLVALRPNVVLKLFSDASMDLLGQVAHRRRAATPATTLHLASGATRLIAAPASKRSVVIVALESVGPAYTSLYGGPYPTTPFLEELARRGALVDRAYAVMPHTSKSLVSVLCGIYPKLVTSFDEANENGIPTRCLPSLLRDQGYATAFFQTAEENFERRGDLVGEMGFERFVGKESIDGRGFDESSYFGWEDDAMLAPIDQWLRGIEGRPFLLSVLTLTSHHPYSIPRKFPVSSFGVQRELNDYLNTVAYSDRFVRKLYEMLRDRGRLSDTLFVVLGDHGEAFGQHGRSQHDSVPYEEALRIPMVIVGSDIGAGSHVVGASQTLDLVPTIVGALGFRPDAPFVGRNLFTEPPRSGLFASCYLHDYCMMLIDGTTKVIHHFGRRADQLFDLGSDPLEQNDLLRPHNHPFAGIVALSLERMKETSNAIDAFYENGASARAPRFVSRSRPDLPLRTAAVTFGDFVELIGYEVSPASVAGGGKVTVTALFHVLKKPESGWDLFLHIDGPGGTNADHVPAEGTYPVSRWEVGDYVVDRYAFATRPTFEAQHCQLRLGFWHRPTGTRAAVSTKEPLRATPDNALEIGPLEVVPAPIDLAAYVTSSSPIPVPLDIQFGGWIRLISAEPDRRAVKAGLRLTTTYVFQPLIKIPDRFEFHVDVEGPSRRSIVHVPVYGAAPPSQWQPGTFVRDPDVLLTRTSDAAGDYRVLLSLYDKQTGHLVDASGRGLPLDHGRVTVAEFQVIR